MKHNPWMKFYPSDWRADQALRACSVAARGFWIECMCIMHEADPYGHLLLNGRPPTDTQLSAMASLPLDQIPSLLDELEMAGVFSRTRTRVIYSRRMTRDAKKRSDGDRAFQTGEISGSRRSKQAADNKAENKPPPRVVSTPPPEVAEKSYATLEARSQKEPPPTPSVAEGGIGSGGPAEIVNWFKTERNRLWPNDPSMTSPTITLKTLAQQQIDAGGSVDLIKEMLTRGMEKRCSMEQSSPSSISAFAKSIADEIAKHKNGKMNSSKCYDNVISLEQDQEGARQRSMMRSWKKTGTWPEDIRGPKPGKAGCRIRPDIMAEFGCIENRNQCSGD